MELSVGTVLDGKVTGIMKFGAFVALPEGRSGLVHISEISYSYVNEVSDHLHEGQQVKVKVIGIDENGRINLSIKQTAEPPRTARPAKRFRSDEGGAPADAPRPAAKAEPTFEDKLKQFMHDSDVRMSDTRLYSEKKSSRRGGRRNNYD